MAIGRGSLMLDWKNLSARGKILVVIGTAIAYLVLAFLIFFFLGLVVLAIRMGFDAAKAVNDYYEPISIYHEKPASHSYFSSPLLLKFGVR